MKQAAGVVLFIEGDRALGGDPVRWLWVRRADRARFLPGFHSFPGGAVDAGDAHMPTDAPSHVTDTAFRVAALRELFEEVGVLRVEVQPSAADAARLRTAFVDAPADGAELFRALGLRWLAADLEPLGRWTAPEFATARFDTVFYACRVESPPALDLRLEELSAAEWITGREAYARWSRAAVRLGPPVAAVIRATLAGSATLDAARVRASHGAAGVPSLRYEFVPGIQTLPLRTPTLPPATHTNAFIVGTGDALLIEPASPYDEEIDRAEAWVKENAAAGITVRALVLTHHHPDHVGGATVLAERLKLPIWAHALTAERLRGSVRVDRELADNEVLEIRGPEPMALRAIHTPGHAPGHLCFLDEASGSLVAGDMVAGIGTIIVEPTDGDMALYLASLARMAELEPTALLPAHGGAMDDPAAVLTRYREHRLARERKVLDALRAWNGEAKPWDLLPVAYADTPELLWPLAAQSTEAHLIYLAQQGHAERRGDAWIAAR